MGQDLPILGPGMSDVLPSPACLHRNRVLSPGQEWYRPTSLASLVSLRSQMLAENRVHRLVCGNTAMGVEKYYAGSPRDVYMWDAGFRAGNLTFAVTVDIKDIPELCGIRRLGSNGLAAGASVSISELAKALEANAAQEPPVADRPMHPYHVLAKHLRRVANNQVSRGSSFALPPLVERGSLPFPGAVLVGVLLAVPVGVLLLAASLREAHGKLTELWSLARFQIRFVTRAAGLGTWPWLAESRPSPRTLLPSWRPRALQFSYATMLELLACTRWRTSCLEMPGGKAPCWS